MGKRSSVFQLWSRSPATSFRVVPRRSSTYTSFTADWNSQINVIRQDFSLPSGSFDLIFFKARIAILCTKGFEIVDLSELAVISYPVYYWMAEVLSTASRASRFRNSTSHPTMSSLNGASHVVPWACYVPAKMSSFSAMMVWAPSVALSVCRLTVSFRIWFVCEPPR